VAVEACPVDPQTPCAQPDGGGEECGGVETSEPAGA